MFVTDEEIEDSLKNKF